MKESRAISFLIVTLVYILAVVLGILVYLQLNFPLWLNLLIADVVATVVTFIFSVIFQNASVYDPYWSVQPIVILVAYAITVKLNTSSILLLISVSVWAIRLTANWAYTFKNLNHQDWRYTMLKEKTGIIYPFVNFTGIHLVPTLIVYACTLPAVYVITIMPKFNYLSLIFFVLSILAVILQGTADVQMHVFRKKKEKGFIRNGLWKNSRHPNYLGEILMWWGVGLYSVTLMPNMWQLLLGALLNTLLFLFISIPMADKRQSQKEGFEEYKNSTNKLFPIPKFKKA